MRKLTATCFIASLAFATGACGGDDGGDDDTTVDAGDEPDAEPPVEVVRSATIAVVQAKLLNPIDENGTPVNGATITGGWSDPHDDVAPVAGFESNINGCDIKVYDLEGGNTFAPVKDEGVVTIEGTANGPIACAFSEAAGNKYVCQPADAAANGAIAVGSTADPIANGLVTYTFEGADFSNANYVGTYIQVSGFPEAAANGTFPVLQQPADNILILGNAALEDETEAEAAGEYHAFAGAGPIPGGFQFLPVTEGAHDPISITKPESDLVAAIDATGESAIVPGGNGFALSNDSADPTAFPAEAAELVYTCEGEGGECGTIPNGIDAITISGEASNGAFDPADPFTVPKSGATKFVTFSCSAIGMTTFTMQEEAVEAILGINPTVVRVAVGRFGAKILNTNDGAARTNILSGNIVNGFTVMAVK